MSVVTDQENSSSSLTPNGKKFKNGIIVWCIFFIGWVILSMSVEYNFIFLRNADESRIKNICVLAAAIICLALAFFIWIKTRIIHPGIYVFLALFVGFPLFGYFKSGFLLLNGLFDKSSPIIHDLTVNGEKVEHGKSLHCFISVPSWKDGEPDFVFPVSAYSTLHVGDKVELVTRKGAFGVEWVRIVPR